MVPPPSRPTAPTGTTAVPGTEPDPARARLLRAGLRLFAHQGYAATSTRELAQAAGVNVASISYYFGDKAGLYRAVFFEPLGEIADDIAAFSGAQLSIEDALRGFYAGFLEPLSQGEDGQLCVKLRMREMLEPTGLWHQEVNEGIKPMHEAMLVRLCRHLGLAAPDAGRIEYFARPDGTALAMPRDALPSASARCWPATTGSPRRWPAACRSTCTAW